MLADEDAQEKQGNEQEERSSAPGEDLDVGPLRGQVPAELRDVSFPSAVRGYERGAVEDYVKRVNQLIAELEVSRSPQAAVRHALDRVGQQTSSVLQRAREVAEELTGTALEDAEQTTARAREEAEEILEDVRMQAHKLRAESKEQAEEILARAQAQAAEQLDRSQKQLTALQDQAEERLRALEMQTEAAAQAHRGVLEDLRRTAAELEKVTSGASDRIEPASARQVPEASAGAEGRARISGERQR